MPKLKDTKLVTKEMSIGDAINKYPMIAEVMYSHGLHCVGCHISPYESIEMGCKGHGMAKKDIDGMIKDINKKIKDSKKD